MKLLFSLSFLFFTFFSLIELSSTQLESESTTSVKPPQVDLCPSPSEIEPCTCYSSGTNRRCLGLFDTGPCVQVFCNGENVTELTFDKLINALHQKAQLFQNPLNSEIETRHQDKVDDSLYSIFLSKTSISQLDLTSLVQTKLKIHDLHLLNNAKLSKFTGPSSSSPTFSTWNKIPCQSLIIWNSPLKDADIGKMLSFLAPEKLELLELSGTLVEGSGGRLEDKKEDCPANPLDSEFFPGLSAFINLEYLWLNRNKIKVVRCSPFFAQGQNLRDLSLENNPLEYIGENGLLFNSLENPAEPNTGQSNSTPRTWKGLIRVSIINSSLDENKFMGNSGLDKNHRNILLRLRGNKFQSLPEILFRPFLEEQGNYFHVTEPLLSCDEKSQWVQDFWRQSQISFGKKNCEESIRHGRNRNASQVVTKSTVSD